MCDDISKVVVNVGGGRPPGYSWTVRVLNQAHSEGYAFLSDDQYAYIAEQVRELARHDDPSHSDVLSVDAIEAYFELREKGSVLAKLNIRLFYGLDHTNRCIVVLGIVKKQNDGATPVATKVTMRKRWRHYQDIISTN